MNFKVWFLIGFCSIIVSGFLTMYVFSVYPNRFVEANTFFHSIVHNANNPLYWIVDFGLREGVFVGFSLSVRYFLKINKRLSIIYKVFVVSLLIDALNDIIQFSLGLN